MNPNSLKPNVCQPATDQHNEHKITAILNLVCEKMHLTQEQVTSKKRFERYVTARKLFALLCREFTGASTKRIGVILHMDHSSVVHQLQRAEEYITTWPYFQKAYRCLRDELQEIRDKEFPEWPFHTSREIGLIYPKKKKQVKPEPVAVIPIIPPAEQAPQPIDRSINGRYSYKSMHA